MFPEVLACAMKAGLHSSYTRTKGLCNFRMAAAFLNQGEKRAVLRPKLFQSMP